MIPDRATSLAALAPAQSDTNSPSSNIRILVEKVAEQIDPPHFFPALGLAQLFHVVYKCTIYCDADHGPEVRIIVINWDDLYRYSPVSAEAPNTTQLNDGRSAVANLTGPVMSVGNPSPAETTGSTDGYAPTDSIALSLTTGPDGTIYKLGGGENGIFFLGNDHRPLVLWRLVSGSTWQPVFPVYSYAVAPDNTLVSSMPTISYSGSRQVPTSGPLSTLPLSRSRWLPMVTSMKSTGPAR